MIRTFRACNIALCIFTLAAYVAPYINPNTWWVFSFFGLSFPVLLFLNIAFLAFWLLRKSKMAWLPAISMMIGINPIQKIAGTPNFSEQGFDSTTLRIATYNTLALREKVNPYKRISPDSFALYIKGLNADILVMQEYGLTAYSFPGFDSALNQKAGLLYKVSQPYNSLAIYAKYPLREGRTRYFQEKSNGYQYADVETNLGTIRVFNIHLQTNAVSKIARQVADEANFRQKQTWVKIKGMLGRFRNSSRVRARQAHLIDSLVKSSPHPVIVAGDLNDTPQSYTYRTIKGGLKDSFQKSGRGIGFTYAGKIPWLRIDYIFASPELLPVFCKVNKIGRSDHYPVLAAFRYK